MAVVIGARPPPQYEFSPPSGRSGVASREGSSSSGSSSGCTESAENGNRRSPSPSNQSVSRPLRTNCEKLDSVCFCRKEPSGDHTGTRQLRSSTTIVQENYNSVPTSMHKRTLARVHSLEKTIEQLQTKHAESLRGLHGETFRLQNVCAELSAQLISTRCAAYHGQPSHARSDTTPAPYPNRAGLVEKGNEQEKLIDQLREECKMKQKEIDWLTQELKDARNTQAGSEKPQFLRDASAAGEPEDQNAPMLCHHHSAEEIIPATRHHPSDAQCALGSLSVKSEACIDSRKSRNSSELNTRAALPPIKPAATADAVQQPAAGSPPEMAHEISSGKQRSVLPHIRKHVGVSASSLRSLIPLAASSAFGKVVSENKRKGSDINKQR